MNSLVSIIITVLNGEAYIKDAIQSLLNQTYTNLEIIVIDDGSTDNTAKIMEGIIDNRISLYKNECNKGLIYSRNLGFELANGEFVGFLDADDIALPHKIKEQVDFLQKNPDFGMVGCWYQIINTQGDILPDIWKWDASPNQIRAELMFNNHFGQSALLIRKEISKKYTYSNEFPVSEDYDLWERIAKEYKVANIQKPLVYYRTHSNQTSRTSNQLIIECSNKVRTRLVKTLVKNPSQAELNLHNNLIAEFVFIDKKKYFYLTDKWFRKLLNANKKIAAFDAEGFSAILFKYWKPIFEQNKHKSIFNTIAYIRSPFFNYLEFNSKDRIKNAFKCFKF